MKVRWIRIINAPIKVPSFIRMEEFIMGEWHQRKRHGQGEMKYPNKYSV